MEKLTREELVGTHIKNDCEDKVKAYLSALRAVGFNLNLPKNPICGIYECHVSKRDGYRVSYVVNKANLDEGSRELHLSDLISLENSKVYTTDREVVRKLAELLGVKYSIDHEKYNSEWYCHNLSCVQCLFLDDYDSEIWHEITEAQVNALYKEKIMGKTNQNTKNARTVYEKVTDLTTDEIAKAMIDGEVFYNVDGEAEYRWDGEEFVDKYGDQVRVMGEYYRKQQVELNWWDEVESKFEFFERSRKNKSVHLNTRNSIDEEHFINFCRCVLRAKGEIE